jgi:hypothetical protein
MQTVIYSNIRQGNQTFEFSHSQAVINHTTRPYETGFDIFGQPGSNQGVGSIQ